LALALLPAAATTANASTPTRQCLAIVAAQGVACQWQGEITISQVEDSSTSLPIGNTGGTVVDETHRKDITTIEVGGDGGGEASREYSFVHTITRNEKPSVQCAAGQPFTTGAHTVVQQQQESGSESSHVPVMISPSAPGAYSVDTARPVPTITQKSSFNETWSICKAPPAQNSANSSTVAGGGILDIGFDAKSDPSAPT